MNSIDIDVGGGFDLDGGVTNSVVQNNYSHDNTAGILVFVLPDLSVKVGRDTRLLRHHHRSPVPGPQLPQRHPSSGPSVP